MGNTNELKLPFALLEAVKEKRAVLVFGAGASKECKNSRGETPPNGLQMRDLLAKKFLGTTNETRDLMTVAEMAASNGAGEPIVFDQIAEYLSGFEPSDAHKRIADFMWRGLATTNYDRFIEQGYSENKDRKQTCFPFVKDIEPYEDRLARKSNPIALLKLHGCIEHRLDTDIPLVLTNGHYHNHLKNRKLLLSRLKDWAQSSVLIFVGYQMADSHIRSLIYDIDATKRPQWYIVSPGLDEHDARFWLNQNVEVVKASFDEFTRALDESIAPLFRSLSKASVLGDQPYQKHFRTHDQGSDFFRQSINDDYEFVHTGMAFAEVEANKFYSGFDDGWCGIVRDYDFHRKTGERLLFKAVDNDNEIGPKLYLLQGSAGSGKTIALKRAAYDAATILDQMVFWLKDGGHPRPEFFEELYSLTGKRMMLFVDQISLHSEAIENLLVRAEETKIPLTVIGAERQADWGSYCENLNTKFSPLVFELSGISHAEAEGLVDLLDRHKCLGMLSNKTKAEQVAAFVEKDRSDRQLLVALHELTQGKPFEDIILEEYERILPEAAKRLYLDIATMHQFGVTARAGAISRISGISFNDFEDEFLKPLLDIVRVRWDGTTGDHGYETRHPKVAEIAFGVACGDDNAKSAQLTRILSGLDGGYSSDAKIIRSICKGHQIARQFSSIEPAREIFTMACEMSQHSAFLFQQAAILEYSHRRGSLDRAEELANTARVIDANNHIYIHTQAEIARRKAIEAGVRVRKEQLRAQSRKFLNEIFLKDVRKDLTFCNLLVDEAIDLLGELSETPREHEVIEFDDKIEEAVGRLSKASQDYPDQSEFLSVEARLWEKLGDGTRAKAALLKAIRAKPRHSGVFARLAKLEGRVEASSDQLGKTLQILNEGLDKFPNDKQLHLQKALLLVESAEQPSPEIEFHFKSSFGAGDNNYDARYSYAVYLFWYGKAAESKDLFEEIDRRAPLNFRTTTPKSDDSMTLKLSEYRGFVEGKKDQYFFIRFGGYPTAIFAYWRSLQTKDYDVLNEGEELLFRIRFNRKGPVAIGAKRVEEAKQA